MAMAPGGTLHALLVQALRQFGAEPRRRADGRFSLAFDDSERLDIHILSPDTLLLEVELATIPPAPIFSSELLRAAAFMAEWSMRHADVVCLDPATRTLLLQRPLKEAGGGPLRLCDDIGRFVSAVGRWRHALNVPAPVGTATGVPAQ